MNVKQIIIKYLKKNKYDGLCGDDCGCGLDELMPCGEGISKCIPAYRHECKTCTDKCEYYDEKETYEDFTRCFKPKKA